MKILITGGAGFIGSALVRYIMKNTNNEILNIDALTYAGNLNSLKDVEHLLNYEFKKINICNYEELKRAFFEFKPNVVMHLAAESHVDRSIDGPREFVQTNVIGTFNLLEISREYYSKKMYDKSFRFHHISTDEVYGDLKGTNDFFVETTPYNPSSPYSASKASSDHLVRAWGRTYGLPILITNCSNNYGPYHFPEKLIPHIILNALSEKPLPVYGDGQQVRDWLYVEDHAEALYLVATEGKIGETYNVGGHNERKNLEVVNVICDELDKIRINDLRSVRTHRELITFVSDRPGHDVRYAIDASKIKRELGWVPKETFESGLKKTINWYLNNSWWYEDILNSRYQMNRMGGL